MSERRLSSINQGGHNPMTMALEAGNSNQVPQNRNKHDHGHERSNTKEAMEDLTVHEDRITVARVESPQRKALLERRHAGTYSRLADPRYTRLLGPAGFDVIVTSKASTSTGFPPLLEKEYKEVFKLPAADEPALSRDGTRKRPQKHSIESSLLPDSRDSGYQPVPSSEPASTPVNDTISPHGVFGSTPEDEYREIFRRHNFSFSSHPPIIKSICRVCGLSKPVDQDTKYHRICNDCHAAISTSNAQTCSSPHLQRRCRGCLLDKPIDGFTMLNGRPVCFDCRNVGIEKRTDRACLDQHADHCNVTRDDITAQLAHNKPRRTSLQPSGFVKSSDLLKSLKNPIATQKTGPKRRCVREEEATRLYATLLQRDQQAWQHEENMKSDKIEPPSSTRYEHAIFESNSRLIDLDIKTGSNAPPIWIKVSRSAPLGEMFVAALQSDYALRGYAFMLPGQFVRWDDTPNELNLKDSDCFEMHELPKAWLPNSRPIVNENAAEASNTSDRSVPDDDSAESSRTDAHLDTEETSRAVDTHDASKTLYFGEMQNDRHRKARNAKDIAYDVDIPKAINAPNTSSSMFHPQQTPSNSSATSNFSLPMISAETEAELPAILAKNDETPPSHASTSEHRYSPPQSPLRSPLLDTERESYTRDTRPELRISASRSPSIIFLHESYDHTIPQQDAGSQNIKANVKRLLSQVPPIKGNMQRIERTGAQQ